MSNIHSKQDEESRRLFLEDIEVSEVTLFKCVPLGLDCLFDFDDGSLYLAITSDGSDNFSRLDFLSRTSLISGRLVRPCRTVLGD